MILGSPDWDKINEIITVNNGQYPSLLLDSIDCCLAERSRNYHYVEISNQPGIHYYHGNIFDLPVDVLVNPINEYGLGCFQIGHDCLDNQIHRRCGPRLRQVCRQVLGPGRILSPGEVFVTPAYHTKSRYIFHALGPQFRYRNDQALLSCYTNSLKLMEEYQATSIAFPEISCGVYGYPKDIARRIVAEGIGTVNRVVYLVHQR